MFYRILSWVLLIWVCLLALVWVLLVSMPRGLALDPGSPPGVIYEDSVFWDCRTMGNQICGPAGIDLSYSRMKLDQVWDF